MLKNFLSVLCTVTCVAAANSASAGTNAMEDYVQSRVLEKNIRSASEFTTKTMSEADLLSLTPRVVGGTAAGPYDNPFQVGLLWKQQPNNAAGFYCGGTLVNSRFVVTAAHCSDFVTANQVQVLVGARNLDGSGRRISVSKITIHPQWQKGTYNHDVAVWELSEPARGIPVASLATRDEPVGTNLLVTGWGSTKQGGSRPIALQRLQVPVVDRWNCNDANSYNGKITENMFCAGFEEGGRDACQGDSGGPLTRGNVLVGITSWGAGCAKPNLFGVYTRVAQPNIRNFIVNAMRNSSGGGSGGGTVNDGQWENNTDRPGWDYKNLSLSQANPALCATQCGQDRVCKAWTYVKPGVQGPNARCFLKIFTPAARPSSCCVSGVKR